MFSLNRGTAVRDILTRTRWRRAPASRRWRVRSLRPRRFHMPHPFPASPGDRLRAVDQSAGNHGRATSASCNRAKASGMTIVSSVRRVTPGMPLMTSHRRHFSRSLRSDPRSIPRGLGAVRAEPTRSSVSQRTVWLLRHAERREFPAERAECRAPAADRRCRIRAEGPGAALGDRADPEPGTDSCARPDFWRRRASSSQAQPDPIKDFIF